MKENCQTCSGRGVIDIVQTWHELTIWCPDCNPEKYNVAIAHYRKTTGINYLSDVPNIGGHTDEKEDNKTV
jgi:excinuclease UvrABC ATPase subunit